MGYYLVSDTDLTAIANKIREKTGENSSIEFASEFISEIEKLAYTGDANATAADILSGKTAYVNKQKLQGTIPSVQTITYNPSSALRIIASGQYLVEPLYISDITSGRSQKQITVSLPNTDSVSGYADVTESAVFSLGASYANKRIIIWGSSSTKGSHTSSEKSFSAIHFTQNLPMIVTADANGNITVGTLYRFKNLEAGSSTLTLYFSVDDSQT